MTAAEMAAKVDVTVENHGSVFLFRPHTSTAREWLDLNVFGLWFGGALAVEPRFAENLADGMINDGLEVA